MEQDWIPPLYIICSEQGVPITNSIYTFTMPLEDLQDFEVAKVKVGNSHQKIEQAFILGITNDDAISISLISCIDELYDSIAKIGLFCELVSIEGDDLDERIVTCKILSKAVIEEIIQNNNRSYAKVFLLSEKKDATENETLEELKNILQNLTVKNSKLSPRIKNKVLSSNSISYISDLIVDNLVFKDSERYNYLQSRNSLKNFIYAIKVLLRDLDIKKNKKASKYEIVLDSLKNHSKVETNKEESIAEKIRKIKFSKESKAKLESELKRLDKLPSSSLEHQALNEYLTWISKLPWNKYTNKIPDLIDLIDILNETHYGLDEVKEHILEYLTIQKITGNPQGTVLCFVGEPGTGKTSIAKQIAKACNRKIIKIALGGMGDESELRGHRRTYVASKPGRIAAGLKTCKTMDPLILLDEIDKIDTRRGDPTSALLELLDPEQNNEFVDRYIEIPIDISSAFFIATANYVENIPAPLRDRMEIINFRNYTVDEKRTIVNDFMIPAALSNYGLEDMDIDISTEAIENLVENNEIRQIKRRLLKFLRKAAVRLVVEKQTKVLIDTEFIESIKAKNKKIKRIGF